MVEVANGMLVLSESPPEWLRQPIEEIRTLLELPENWDSYGARRIEPHNAAAGVELLAAVMKPKTPRPSIVPTNRGGIQIEWHCGGVDLEIEVQSPSRFHVFFEDVRAEESWENTLSSDLRPLLPCIERLSKA